MLNVRQEAENRLQKFVCTIQALAVTRQIHFDLLVCGGNTGLVMAYIAKQVYIQNGLTPPRQLALPIYRFYPGYLDDMDQLFDNSGLQPQVEAALEQVPLLQNVLFVDDEIGLGITTMTIMGFLSTWQQAHHAQKGFTYYIVAEDQGFQVNQRQPGVRIVFAPYANEIDGWNNLVSYIVPSEYEAPIKRVFPDEILPFHQRLNILLGLPIKEFNEGKPRYSATILEQARRALPNLNLLQQGFRYFLKERIRTYSLLFQES